jgi:hypothetical protein
VTFLFWTGPGFDFAGWLAVASAARWSPTGATLYVDEVTGGSAWLDAASRAAGVSVIPFLPDAWLSRAEALRYRGAIHPAHRSDIARFGVLRRAGGLYLDTDTITCAPLGVLPPSFVVRDERIVHLGVLALSDGHPLIDEFFERLMHVDPSVLDNYSSLVHLWTGVVDDRSDPVVALPASGFFPVPWPRWEELFDPASELELDGVVSLHHYGAFSRRLTGGMDHAWPADHPCPFSAAARRAQVGV